LTTGDRVRKDLATRTVLTSIILALLGALFIAASLILGFLHTWEYAREIFKELGIVLFSVFTVSLIYERLMAEKHLEGFSAMLRSEIKEAERNAAACNELGIVDIFPSRDALVNQYPFGRCLNGLGDNGRARFVALSLFHVMNKAEIIRRALLEGTNIEFCLLTPDLSSVALSKLPDLEIQDIGSAVAVFKKQLAIWTMLEKPPGRLELRYHDTLVPESFTYFSFPELQLAFWDLSFGRDMTDKRMFVVDPSRRLGKDLRKRFDLVFEQSDTIFLFEQNTVKVNKLGDLAVALSHTP